MRGSRVNTGAKAGINISVSGPSLSTKRKTPDILDVTVIEENNLRLLYYAFSTSCHPLL